MSLSNSGPNSKALVAFVPHVFATHLKDVARVPKLTLVASWNELNRAIGTGVFAAAIMDPHAGGSTNTAAAIRIVEQYQPFPILAYVPVSPHHLKAVAALGMKGLSGVIVHPIRDFRRDFWRPIERATPDSLTLELFRALEAASRIMPVEVFRAIEDLISHPDRYQRGADLAYQAGIPVKTLYRTFVEAGLGTPKRILVATKLLRALACCEQCEGRRGEDITEFGNKGTSWCAAQSLEIFGCSLSYLARHADRQELMMQLLEWIHRPSRGLRGARRLNRSARPDTAPASRPASRRSTL